MKNLPSTSGIYTITNLQNNKIYIGFAVNLKNRKVSHWSTLKSSRHKNEYLQRAWNKYGEENFLFEVIEECSEDLLEGHEHYWCNLLNSHNKKFGYNIRPTHPYGNCRHSISTRTKLSSNRKGVKLSEESIQKRTRTRKEKGYKHSDETKKKMSVKATGRNHSLETIDKLKNRKYSIETRARMSSAHTGKKQSEETVEKRMQKVRGVRKPAGFGAKISKARKGKSLSDSNKKAISIAKSIPILQCDLEGNIIREWIGAHEAARELNMSPSCINQVCNKKEGRKQHAGYRWIFKIIENDTNG